MTLFLSNPYFTFKSWHKQTDTQTEIVVNRAAPSSSKLRFIKWLLEEEKIETGYPRT